MAEIVHPARDALLGMPGGVMDDRMDRLENRAEGVRLVRGTRLKANEGGAETMVVADAVVTGDVWPRARFAPVTVAERAPDFANYRPAMLRSTHAHVTFSYSLDGMTFTLLGEAMMT